MPIEIKNQYHSSLGDASRIETRTATRYIFSFCVLVVVVASLRYPLSRICIATTSAMFELNGIHFIFFGFCFPYRCLHGGFCKLFAEVIIPDFHLESNASTPKKNTHIFTLSVQRVNRSAKLAKKDRKRNGQSYCLFKKGSEKRKKYFKSILFIGDSVRFICSSMRNLHFWEKATHKT